PLLPVIPEGLEKVEGRLKLVSGQKFDRLVEVMGVPVLFQNVLGPLDADHVVKGEHLAGKHFVGGAVDVDIAVFFRLAPQTRAAEKLQKAQLQLLRFQGEHVVERLFEGSVILLRQSGDQVQMLDDLPALPEGAHGAGQFFKVLPPLDQFVGEGIGRLNADLEAENARRRVFVQKTDDLRPKDIGGDLELKHASAMVVDQKAEQLQGEGAVNVEGSVDELDRFGRVLNQVQDVFLDPVDIEITHPALNGRKAELAAEGTAATGLHVHDALGEVGPILRDAVRRGDPVQIQLGARRIDDDATVPAAAGKTQNDPEVSPSGQFLQQLFEGFLSLPVNDEVRLGDAPEPVLDVVGDLRSAENDFHVGPHLLQDA